MSEKERGKITCCNLNSEEIRVTLPFTRHRRSEKPPPVSLADVSPQTPESETQRSSLNT
ncbi:hypothetical protein F2Q70_00000756 [Brassica cretica]|uniref:Uncharacterized protein n=1 Tax=Brassica cretica TaxID=69181 RepID=A0A8S9IJI2_BRACR|nr:hypothetical protein F2Q70_00000756 [Brassica cretica]